MSDLRQVTSEMKRVSPPLVIEASYISRDASISWRGAFVISAMLALTFVLLAYILEGKGIAEKTLTHLIMPVGFFWILLTGRTIQLLASKHTRAAIPLMIACIGLWIAGTRPLGQAIGSRLENREKLYDPKSGPAMDAVIVLGGGTSRGPERAQAASSGDRIVYAAELFHQGLTKKLITTGEAQDGQLHPELNPSNQTIELWTKLGVPREKILVVGGRNTFEELQDLKKNWKQIDGDRVGLITSALHLPRAMRLARSQSLDLLPMAADYTVTDAPWVFLDFIPNAGGLTRLAALQHELMASFVNR